MPRRPSWKRVSPRLDLEIIARLQEDARKPFTAIAEEFGLPESTVRKRVTRLKNLGVVQFTAFADPMSLGFQHWSLVQIKTDFSTVEATAAEIAKYPQAFFVGITTGEYDILLAGVFRSDADLLSFLTGRLPKMPGFRTSLTSNILKLLKRRGPLFADRPRGSRLVLPGQQGPGNRQSVRFQPLDRKLIALLQKDGRQSFSRVAVDLGTSESTVRRRVAYLQELGVLHFETFADPLRLGFQYWALIQLSVAPTHIDDVAARLAAFPELFFVGVTTGPFDIFAAGVFRSNEELLGFLTDPIGRIRWSRAVSTTNVLKVVKRQFVYPLGTPRAVEAPANK